MNAIVDAGGSNSSSLMVPSSSSRLAACFLAYCCLRALEADARIDVDIDASIVRVPN